MGTTRAYIAGFGTAGSLLAGAAVVFVLASAVVSFRGWPQLDNHLGAPTFVRATAHASVDSAGTRRVAAVLAAQGAAGLPAGAVSAQPGPRTIALGATSTSVATAGGGQITASRGIPVPATPVGAVGAGPPSAGGGGSSGGGLSGAVQQTTGALGSTVAASGASLGSTVSSVAGSLGGTVNGLSSSLAGTVKQTGQVLGSTVTGATGAAGSTLAGAGKTVGALLGGH